jgi:prepilin-type N-terminal cleavage/methylation domain-containing protein
MNVPTLQKCHSRMNDTKKRMGFTIVELLIVVAVIGILAAITTIAYSGIQDKARATALIDGIKNIEDSFRLLAVEQKTTTWWNDNSFTGIDNPTLDEVIANSNLKNYLASTPDVPGSTPVWTYDNDSDVRAPTACDVTWSGVILTIASIPIPVITNIDNAIDDGDPMCGKVRGNGTRLIYNLSFDQTIR